MIFGLTAAMFKPLVLLVLGFSLPSGFAWCRIIAACVLDVQFSNWWLTWNDGWFSLCGLGVDRSKTAFVAVAFLHGDLAVAMDCIEITAPQNSSIVALSLLQL
jgi:hypothetical protein